MPTLTLDLPDTAYRAALTLTRRERNRFAAVMFATLETIDADLPDFDRETNEADLESIGRVLEAEAWGETIPGDVAFARLRLQARRANTIPAPVSLVVLFDADGNTPVSLVALRDTDDSDPEGDPDPDELAAALAKNGRAQFRQAR